MKEDIIKKYYKDNDMMYHTYYHIEDMYFQWKCYRECFLKEFPNLDEDKLFLCIDYHDSYYIPGCDDNEEKSVLNYMNEENIISQDVIDAILSTKINNQEYKTDLQKVLHDLDWHGFKDYHALVNHEKKIIYEACKLCNMTEQEVYNRRQEFYKSLIDKPIYLTETFSKFNAIAANNIRRRIDK